MSKEWSDNHLLSIFSLHTESAELLSPRKLSDEETVIDESSVFIPSGDGGVQGSQTLDESQDDEAVPQETQGLPLPPGPVRCSMSALAAPSAAATARCFLWQSDIETPPCLNLLQQRASARAGCNNPMS